jgi:signal transduction histidine kinase
LQLIISNLLENALKYSPDSSVVHVRTNECKKVDSEGVLIQFINEIGPAGFPDPDRVFEKYYRSPGAQSISGSGLGLYLVRSFTEMLGGKIQLYTVNNQITFELWIPR